MSVCISDTKSARRTKKDPVGDGGVAEPGRNTLYR